MTWLSPLAGKLGLHSSVATSALGRGMDSSLAEKLAAGHATHEAEASSAVGSCQGAPATWGPAMWKSLHCLVHNMPQHLPPEQQRSFEDMMTSLPSTLPCGSCGDHLRQHLHDDPPTPYLATRDDLERWLVRLHNTVNVETGKAPVSESEALTNINNMCACTDAAAPQAPGEEMPATMASMGWAWPALLCRPCAGLRKVAQEEETEEAEEETEVAEKPKDWQDFM
ncbi:Putative FAD-linked sulfhydryl oxidase 347L [Durusdinium trenchii]|uniref:Sulfhydryl oxidase n=1 Tax=Durusdinium trenchii TaxID=1381693 RepID=A0ABP0LX19_9DINO